jgi:F0F1-type ATP synthase epsilon subunit
MSDSSAEPTVSLHPTMHIKVYSPYKVYYDQDDCESISALNDTGPFDILAHHHNFMTLLNPGDLEIYHGSEMQRIRITRGIMHVKADRVTVFLDV